MARRRYALLLLLGLVVPGLARKDVDLLPADAARRYEAIRPTAAEQQWKQIPWMVALDQGLTTAKKEKRPLFLWVSGDDPLNRC